MKHGENGSLWHWRKEKFVNRCYIMREIYELFAAGGGGLPPELSRDQDPFWDPPEPVLVGVANVYLSSLSYLIEFEDAVDCCNFKGKVEGVLQVHIQPCHRDGSLPTEVGQALPCSLRAAPPPAETGAARAGYLIPAVAAPTPGGRPLCRGPGRPARHPLRLPAQRGPWPVSAKPQQHR